MNTGNKCFDAVFATLPPMVKTRLEDYWRKTPYVWRPEYPEPLKQAHSSPWVIIGEDWSEHSKAISKKAASSFAMAFARGTAIVFDKQMYDLPPLLIATLIAHEIGHCYQYAGYNGPPRDERASERQVNSFMERWGYFDNDIDMWLEVCQSGQPDPENAFHALRLKRYGRKPPEYIAESFQVHLANLATPFKAAA